MYGAIIFDILVLIAFVIYYFMNKKKAQEAFKLSVTVCKKLIPLLLIIVVVLVFLQRIFADNTVVQLMTKFGGVVGYAIAAALGALIPLPLFLSVPISGQLLQKGVYPGIVATLVSSLIMVHFFTLPLESKELGLKYALARNILSLIASILIGIILGVFY